MRSDSRSEQAALISNILDTHMDQRASEKEEKTPRARKKGYLSISLGAIGFGLAIAVTLIIRSETYNFAIMNSNVARITQISICALIVIFAGFHLIKPFHMIAAATISTMLFALIVYVLPIALAVDLYADSVFFNWLAIILDGIASTLLTLAFLFYLSSYDLRFAIACIPLAMSGAHALYLIALYMPGVFAFWLRLVCLVGSCAMAAILLSIGSLDSREGRIGSFPKPSVRDSSTFRHLFASFLSEFSSLGKGFAIILSSAAAFPFLYVLVSYLNNALNASPNLYNFTAELIVFVALLVVALVVLIGYNHLGLETICVIVNLLFATALLLLPRLWGNEVFVSGIMMKTGFIVFNALLWCHIAKNTHGSMFNCLFVFGFAQGMLFLFGYFGRLAGRMVFERNTAVQGIITDTALVAIWVLSISILVSFLFLRRQRDAQKKKADPIARPSNSGLDPFLEKCQAFINAYGLSEREAEVLVEYTRGRSADKIARSMFISFDTVKTYLRRIYAKVDVHSRQELLDKIDNLSKGNDD